MTQVDASAVAALTSDIGKAQNLLGDSLSTAHADAAPWGRAGWAAAGGACGPALAMAAALWWRRGRKPLRDALSADVASDAGSGHRRERFAAAAGGADDPRPQFTLWIAHVSFERFAARPGGRAACVGIGAASSPPSMTAIVDSFFPLLALIVLGWFLRRRSLLGAAASARADRVRRLARAAVAAVRGHRRRVLAAAVAAAIRGGVCGRDGRHLRAHVLVAAAEAPGPSPTAASTASAPPTPTRASSAFR